MFPGTAITRSGYATKGWRPFTSFSFASSYHEAPLTNVELEPASRVLPIALRKLGERLKPYALLGLEPGASLFVGEDGRWLGTYVPACFRGYPFCILHSDDGQQVLAEVTGNDLVGEGFERPFFDETGQLAPQLRQVADFLHAVLKDDASTDAVIAAVVAEGIVSPWEIILKDGATERSMDGLYRVDEAKLAALDDAALGRLHRVGALRFCYAQIFSQKNFQNLVNLYQARAQTVVPTKDVDVDSILSAVGTTAQTVPAATVTEDVLPISVYDDGEIDLAALVGSHGGTKP